MLLCFILCIGVIVVSVPLAFLAVIIIWSTTPLGIQWSVEGVGFLFGVSTRMLLGIVLAVFVMWIMRHPFLVHRQAWFAYLASGLGIYCAMIGTYWGAMYIPSGWISVIWGLSPMVTGVLASVFIGEKSFVPHRILGTVSGICGLAVIFFQGAKVGESTALGVGLVLLGVFGQTSTAVWIKKINAGIHGIVMTVGGLLVAVPLFWLTWWLAGGVWPEYIPDRAIGAIVYLAVFGSVLGFSLYYFLLNSVEASRVALITLITPVTALLLGYFFNGETLTVSVFLGTALILLGLFSFEWGGKVYQSWINN